MCAALSSIVEKIDDNYPKFVVCSDETDWSRNGFGCRHIVDCLLFEEWERA